MLDVDTRRRRREVDALVAAARTCLAASRIKRGAATEEQRLRSERSALQRANEAVRRLFSSHDDHTADAP